MSAVEEDTRRGVRLRSFGRDHQQRRTVHVGLGRVRPARPRRHCDAAEAEAGAVAGRSTGDTGGVRQSGCADDGADRRRLGVLVGRRRLWQAGSRRQRRLLHAAVDRPAERPWRGADRVRRSVLPGVDQVRRGVDLGQGRLLPARPRQRPPRAQADDGRGPSRQEGDTRGGRRSSLPRGDQHRPGVRLGRQRPRSAGERLDHREQEAVAGPRAGRRESESGLLRLQPQRRLGIDRPAGHQESRAGHVPDRQGSPRSNVPQVQELHRRDDREYLEDAGGPLAGKHRRHGRRQPESLGRRWRSGQSDDTVQQPTFPLENHPVAREQRGEATGVAARDQRPSYNTSSNHRGDSVAQSLDLEVQRQHHHRQRRERHLRRKYRQRRQRHRSRLDERRDDERAGNERGSDHHHRWRRPSERLSERRRERPGWRRSTSERGRTGALATHWQQSSNQPRVRGLPVGGRVPLHV